MERTILIEGRDPLLFRDGKPSLTSLPMRSLGWPMPSAIAGAIRTRLGVNTNYDAATVSALKEVEHVGPFLAAQASTGAWEVCFPAPADLVAYDDGDDLQIHPLRPTRTGPAGGSNLPGGLSPLCGAIERKASSRAPAFWTQAATLDWLARVGNATFKKKPESLGFPPLLRQPRMHVSIERGTQTAAEGMLYSTEALEFEREGVRFAIASRISTQGGTWAALPAVAPLGGERRLAYWSENRFALPAAPASLKNVRLLRLQLATPAWFAEGWRPGWCTEGTPPGTQGLRLKLVAAAIPRAVACSGWELEMGRRGPKPTRFLAPAGSVYFFEVEEGDPSQLWLKPVSDDDQLRRDGFGIVLCGEWKWR